MIDPAVRVSGLTVGYGSTPVLLLGAPMLLTLVRGDALTGTAVAVQALLAVGGALYVTVTTAPDRVRLTS